MAREWRGETDRWLLGYCWLPLAVGTLVLEAFGGGEFLDIAIPTLVPLVFFFSLLLSLVYAMMILNLIMHTTAKPGGGREHVK